MKIGKTCKGAPEIRNCRYRGRPARLMLVDGAMESATYREAGLRNELIFPYLRQISQAFSFRAGIRDTLLLGGGGFAYPKYYISHYPDKRMDAVEIRQNVIDAARRSFYLDEAIRGAGMEPREVFQGGCMRPEEGSPAAGTAPEESLRGSGRLRIFCEDGMDYLLRCGRRYDLIINDAFDGRTASGTLGSEDGLRLIRSHLKPDGLYVVNVAAAREGWTARGSRKLVEAVSRHFRFTALIPCEDERSGRERQNHLLFASNAEL